MPENWYIYVNEGLIYILNSPVSVLPMEMDCRTYANPFLLAGTAGSLDLTYLRLGQILVFLSGGLGSHSPLRGTNQLSYHKGNQLEDWLAAHSVCILEDGALVHSE